MTISLGAIWAQGSFSGSHWIARPGKITFETILVALGGVAHFSKEDVDTPEGAIRPAFPWEHSQKQTNLPWCFLTASDRLTNGPPTSSRVIIKIILIF